MTTGIDNVQSEEDTIQDFFFRKAPTWESFLQTVGYSESCVERSWMKLGLFRLCESCIDCHASKILERVCIQRRIHVAKERHKSVFVTDLTFSYFLKNSIL